MFTTSGNNEASSGCSGDFGTLWDIIESDWDSGDDKNSNSGIIF